jgi:formiminotetrahydrofolate cyclodeaminase
MYCEGKFKEYLDDLAAKKPAPGGGSVAAAAGAGLPLRRQGGCGPTCRL